LPVSFWISHQYPICIPLLTHSCYMPCPSHPPWLWTFRLHKSREIHNHLSNFSPAQYCRIFLLTLDFPGRCCADFLCTFSYSACVHLSCDQIFALANDIYFLVVMTLNDSRSLVVMR
jgi:hypothetical protein